MSADIVLIGAGGHAKVILQILMNLKYNILGFIDEKVDHFINLQKVSDDFLFSSPNLGHQLGKQKFETNHHLNKEAVIAFGAINVEGLKRRTCVFQAYRNKQITFPAIVDVTAIVAETVRFDEGVTVSPGVIINANVSLSQAVIINTGVIVEHDVSIGEGSHIAPGAIVLGGARVGMNCMVGAGAVILPYTAVPDNTLVPALTRYSGS